MKIKYNPDKEVVKTVKEGLKNAEDIARAA